MIEQNEVKASTQKWCNQCNRFRLKTQFYQDRTKNDGLRTRCMTCMKKTSRVAYRQIRAGMVEFKNMTAAEYAEHRRQDMREARVAARKWVLRVQMRALKEEQAKLKC